MHQKIEKKKLLIVILINILIFAIVNIITTVKYEQVDDFIIYNLYSGLDGTNNFYGVYIHPIICIILGNIFRIIPYINWHSIYLLSMQFICFTLIGYKILKKQDNKMSIILYTIFASICYTILLMFVQYTSVEALLIFTSFFLIIDEEDKINKKILIFILYTIGILTRMQSVLMVLPFMLIYLILKIFSCKRNKNAKVELKKLFIYYIIYFIITVIVYISNLILTNSNAVYKEYTEYNFLRTQIQDFSYLNYEENKEIFDEVGWSENDHFLFYTFNFGDENIYSKENLQKIYEYKIQKYGKMYLDIDIKENLKDFFTQIIYIYTFIFIIFISFFVTSLFTKEKNYNNILFFLIPFLMHIIFIFLGRCFIRVVLPEYIMGIALILYNIKIENDIKINYNIKNITILVIIIIILSTILGKKYERGYKLEKYDNYRELINYTSNQKNNVYLYTVPSLQDRYLTYSVYEMPPEDAFENLRVIGGWDMYTQNYYDFKIKHNLEGNLLDLLKDNVYLIDGDVIWSGKRYDNYKENIILAIKENYNKEVICKEIKQFKNLSIYKLEEK